ncbi:MAG: MarR family transcriptional regulator [Glaciecola sp.]
MSYPQLTLDKQLCHRLYMASNSIIRAYREPLNALNITYPQYVVMMALWETSPLSIAELLKKTVIDGGAMTQILKKMSDKNLIEIVTNAQDKRKREVHLSKDGLALREQAKDIPASITCKFSQIDTAQAQQLMQLLDKVVSDLNA